MISEAHGIPLAVSLTGGNRNDVTQLMPLIGAIPPVRGRRGRPRQRPGQVYADRGYDHDKYRKQVREKGITPVIARRSTEHGSGLGVHRWVIEQSIALLHWFRRLRIRWEIRDDIHEAFLSLACAIICFHLPVADLQAVPCNGRYRAGRVTVSPVVLAVAPIRLMIASWLELKGLPRQFLGIHHEQAVLNYVPLAGTWRQVTDAQFAGPVPAAGAGRRGLPRLASAAVADPPLSALISRRHRATTTPCRFSSSHTFRAP